MRQGNGYLQDLQSWATRKNWVRIALCGVATTLLLIAAVAIGAESKPATGSSEPHEVAGATGYLVHHHDSESAGTETAWVPTSELVQRGEALPCTGPRDPINFEIFSAGSEVAGLPMTATVRRCDTASPAEEAPANRITYMYGECEISPTATGCAPPLEVQSWPACQRNLAGYTFEGKPMTYRELPRRGAAKVVEIDFALESRVEVYTSSTTIVIFADSPDLARKAVGLLIPQKKGQPPVTNRAGLRGVAPEALAAPSDGAMKGKLQCQS